MHITPSPQRGEGWEREKMLEVSIGLEISTLTLPLLDRGGFYSSFYQRFQHNFSLFPA